MEDKHRKILTDELDVLSSNCNFESVLEFLKYRNVFTSRQLQHYESESFRSQKENQKCMRLITDIQTRGPNAFFILEECFQKTGHATQYRIMKGMEQGKVDMPPTNVVAVKSSKSLRQGENYYKMTSSPKGKHIFINNIKFASKSNRNGAKHDGEFQETLSQLGFEGDYHENKTTQEMRKLIQDLASDESLSNVDSCMVVICSHGLVSQSHELVIEGCDNDQSNPLLSDEIISLFNSDMCKLRSGCPKIFIFQACRGDGYVRNETLLDLSYVKQAHHPWKDTFLLAPCIEGLLANRFPDSGTWLILALKDIFSAHAYNTDLASMKNLINDKFEEFNRDAVFQQTFSYSEYGVSKKLYFNPGLYERQE